MASLTPGVLSKLLENVNNIDAKVTGEHRSALLQVIGIVPALVGGDDADPFRSHGYFLRVSDSVHSAYVSIHETDIDLILSDKIQLGQFIYVSRLDSASPVPVLRGLRPVPKRRPCIGEPKDLISSDSLLNVRNKTSDVTQSSKTSDFMQSSKTSDFMQSSKTSDLMHSSKKSSSAVKGVKREGYRKAEEKALAVVKTRKSSPPKTARRLSVDIGRIEGLGELRRLSLDSPRRGWDQSPRSKSSPKAVHRGNSRDGSCSSRTPPEVSHSRKVSEKDSGVKRPTTPTSSVSPLTNKNQNISQKSKSKSGGKDSKPSPDTTPPRHLTKVPVSFRSWSDRKVSWDSLPRAIHDLGKETTGNRNLAFLAAVQAMEEASASDRVIQCMSMFAELCESAQTDSAGQVVAQFLDLHQAIQKAASTTNALLNTSTQQRNTSPYSKYPLMDICEDIPNKNALSWVVAAVETNLSGFSLYRKGDQKEISNEERSHFIVLENTPKKTEPENHSPQSKRSPSGVVAKGPSPTRRFSSAPKKPEPERKEWAKGSGLKDASVLAEKLLVMSRAWFLNYFEDSLNKRFELNSCEGSSDVASLLRQLKRVNQWLDDTVADESGTDQRIERLRKKLYGFLLEHVDSVTVACK